MPFFSSSSCRCSRVSCLPLQLLPNFHKNEPAQLVANHDGTCDGLRSACAHIAVNVDQDIKEVLRIVCDNIMMEALRANCIAIESMGIPIVKIVRATGEDNKMALVINLSQVRQEFAQLPILTSEEVMIAWIMIILVAIVFLYFIINISMVIYKDRLAGELHVCFYSRLDIPNGHAKFAMSNQPVAAADNPTRTHAQITISIDDKRCKVVCNVPHSHLIVIALKEVAVAQHTPNNRPCVWPRQLAQNDPS